MQIALLMFIKLWREISIGALIVLVAIMSLLYAQRGNKIELIVANNELNIASQQAAYQEQARKIESDNYAQTIKSVNEYKAREQVIIADAASANASVVSLSNTLSEVSAAAKLNAELGDRYIDTSRRIITECTSEYSKMGEIASRLGNDLRLSQQASRR